MTFQGYKCKEQHAIIMEIAVSLPFVAWAVYLHRSNWSNFAALKRSPSLNLLGFSDSTNNKQK